MSQFPQDPQAGYQPPGAYPPQDFAPPKSSFRMTSVVVLVGIVLLVVVGAIWLVRTVIDRRGSTACQNNLRNVALAALGVDSKRNKLPGFAQELSTRTVPGVTRSAFYMMLPELERSDLYRAYSPEQMPADLQGAPFVEIFICPEAGFSHKGPELSFVLNSGLPDDPQATPRDWPQNGVFLDLRPAADGTPAPISSLNQIRSADGAANTLMLLENLQAGWWTSTDETEVGCVWHPKYRRDPLAQMNSEPPDDAPSDPYRPVRPSSNHRGGVNVAFCDCHIRFLSDQIDYLVYAALMTSNGQRAALPGKQDGVPDEFRNYVLQEGDF